MKYIKLFENKDLSEEDIIKAIKKIITEDVIRDMTHYNFESIVGIDLDDLESGDDISEVDGELYYDDDEGNTGLDNLTTHITYTYLNPIIENIKRYVGKNIMEYVGESLKKLLEKDPALYFDHKDFLSNFDDLPEHLKRANKSGLLDAKTKK